MGWVGLGWVAERMYRGEATCFWDGMEAGGRGESERKLKMLN
jgi:hypothetical protein